MVAAEQPVPGWNITLFKNTFFLFIKAVKRASRGKVCAIDPIPSEVLYKDISISFLFTLFNVCFSKDVVPAIWGNA